MKITSLPAVNQTYTWSDATQFEAAYSAENLANAAVFLSNFRDIMSSVNTYYQPLLNSCRTELREIQGQSAQASITYYASANATEDSTHFKSIYSAISALPKCLNTTAIIMVATQGFSATKIAGFYGAGQLHISSHYATVVGQTNTCTFKIENNQIPVFINGIGGPWSPLKHNKEVRISKYVSTAVTLWFYNTFAVIYSAHMTGAVGIAGNIRADMFSRIYCSGITGVTNGGFKMVAIEGSIIVHDDCTITSENSAFVSLGGVITGTFV